MQEPISKKCDINDKKQDKVKHIKEILSQGPSHPFYFPTKIETNLNSIGESKDNVKDNMLNFRRRENIEARARLSVFDTFLFLLESQLENVYQKNHDVQLDAPDMNVKPPAKPEKKEVSNEHKLDTAAQTNNTSKIDTKVDTEIKGVELTNDSSKMEGEKKSVELNNDSSKVESEKKSVESTKDSSKMEIEKKDNIQHLPPPKKIKLDEISQRNKDESISFIKSRLEENYMQKESVAKYQTIKNLAAFDDFLYIVPQVKYCDIKDFHFLDDDFMQDLDLFSIGFNTITTNNHNQNTITDPSKLINDIIKKEPSKMIHNSKAILKNNSNTETNDVVVPT